MESVWVTFTIPPDKKEEFLQVAKVDSEESRKEEGCLRFDVLQSKENPDVYHFYEVYKSADAAAFHKTLPHYKVWADFKAANPSIAPTQSVTKALSLFE
mmetsp:Transcript_3401/g.7678  ORF Transcript_3401/g.7678 Transcript_3401/m.7678 type:complete len:99 (+) Transcript_3401:55-351(+)